MPPRVIKKIEHSFKKTLQFPFKLLIKHGDLSKLPLDPLKIKSILILRPDKMGDMISSIPVMHALKKKFTHIRLEVIASPANKELIVDDPLIDEIHIYSKNILHDWPTIRKLKKKKFDIIYDPLTHDSVTGLLLSNLIRNNSVIAASRKLKYKKYYDYCLPYDPDGTDHNFDNGLLIFNLFGINPETIDPFQSVFIPDDSVNKANRFFDTLPNDGKKSIGLNVSAGSPTRTLSIEKYTKIIDRLADQYRSFRFIIICTMTHREDARKLISDSHADCVLIPENLSLLDVCAIIFRLKFLISPDTSLVHIARLMEIPVVGLYSGHRRNFNFWRPYRQNYGAVVAKNISNLFDIEPEQVVDEFNRLYDSLSQSTVEKTETKRDSV
jgi:ADP-heptose:LPS heptosyltransferase